MVQRFCDTDNERAGYKRAFKPNFPNFLTVTPRAKFFEPRQIWYQNAPYSTQISKTVGSLRKHLKHSCVTRNWAFSFLTVRKSLEFFCKQTRSGITPTRKADPNIFLIALKQDYIDAQYVKLM